MRLLQNIVQEITRILMGFFQCVNFLIVCYNTLLCKYIYYLNVEQIQDIVSATDNNYMLKIKEYIIENKEKVAIAFLGLAAAGGLVYLLTRKSKPQEKPTITPPQLCQSKVSATSTAQHNKEPEQEQEPEDEKTKKLTQIINKVRAALQKNNDRITPEVIRVIIQGQYDLSNEQIKSAITKSRRQRRSKIDDHFQYAKIITKHQLELESIQQKYLSLILARFNIDKVTWSDASAEWEQQTGEDDQGISDLVRQEEQKQLLSLRNQNNKAKTIKQVLQILQHKIQTLQSLQPEELGFNLGADEAVRYDMIETYVYDILYKQFNVEHEDLEYSIEQFNKDDKEKVIECEDRIADLMDGLIQVDEQEKNQEGEFH